MIAAERWPREGTPEHPRAWLVTTARNRAIDRIRRDRTLATKIPLLEVPEAELKGVRHLVREEMCRAYDLDPPLAVDVGTGDDWTEAKS